MDERTKSPGRRMASFRLQPDTLDILTALAERLTSRDGMRIVSKTEVVERAIRHLAREKGIR